MGNGTLRHQGGWSYLHRRGKDCHDPTVHLTPSSPITGRLQLGSGILCNLQRRTGRSSKVEDVPFFLRRPLTTEKGDTGSYLRTPRLGGSTGHLDIGSRLEGIDWTSRNPYSYLRTMTNGDRTKQCVVID